MIKTSYSGAGKTKFFAEHNLSCGSHKYFYFFIFIFSLPCFSLQLPNSRPPPKFCLSEQVLFISWVLTIHSAQCRKL